MFAEHISFKNNQLSWRQLSFALIISTGYFLFYWSGSSMPVGIHADELRKLDQVVGGWRNHNHPLFMIHNLEMLKLLTEANSIDKLSINARPLVCLYGALTVFFTFFLARQIMGVLPALFAAALCGATPMLGVHAQYIKEDIFASPLIIISLFMFIRFSQKPSLENAVLSGAFIGLAVSAKYVSAILIVPWLYTVFMSNKMLLQGRMKVLSASLLTLSAVMLIIQWPALLDLVAFGKGFEREFSHAFGGHVLYLGPMQTSLLFHLKESLVPGLGWPVVVAAVVGIVLVLTQWKKASLALQIIVIFSLVWYMTHEISPTKPFPASIRYMLSVTSVFSILAIYCLLQFFRYISDRIGTDRSFLVFLMAGALLVCVTLISAYPVVVGRPADTRVVFMSEFYKQIPGKVLMETYVSLKKSGHWTLGADELQGELLDADFAIVSSFMYGRYIYGADLKGINESIRVNANNYKMLFSKPYMQLSAPNHTLAFHNPVIRIIALSAGARSWLVDHADDFLSYNNDKFILEYVDPL